ncbi:MAG TPA: TetR family transcriptional regulator, partial [Chryseobacterium sp.]|nr:TetR family transcriptional regulator [Chryseobacterium sp.]
RDEHIERAVQSNNSLLIRQLIKYYPAIFNKHMMDFAEKFSEVMVHNIERGRQQGYYR